MKRFTLPAFFVLAVALSASAQPQKLDLNEQSLVKTFNELLPKMEKDSATQQRWQGICTALGAPGNDNLRAAACLLMCSKYSESPPATNLWFLTQLERIGGEESVAPLAAIMNSKDETIREAAVRAMANNPSKKATGELVTALGTAEDKAKIGILNALGHRGDKAAVKAVANEISSSDESVAVAAARALGRIPSQRAINALDEAGTNAKGRVLNAIYESLLVHADRVRQIDEGDMVLARDIYRALSKPDKPKPIRLAALRGTIQIAGDEAGDVILKTLAGDDAGAKAVAIGQIESLSAGALKPLAASLDKLPVPSRVAVITAIAARKDKSQLPVALLAAKSDNAEVKRAGIVALGRLGDANTVEFLLDAMSGKDATAGIAAESLAALPAEGVNEKLIAVLEAEKTPARSVALIGVLERRKATGAVAALLKAAGGNDAGVRLAAFSGLKTLASPEHVPSMIAALLKTAKGNERDQAELAIVAVAAQLPADKRAEPALAAIKADTKHTAELLPLLGRLGGSEALKAIREAISSTDAALHDAGIASLCNWPDVAANGELLTLAEKGKTDAEKLRGLQALTRINTGTSWIERTPDERLAALGVMKKAMALASRDDERRAILDGIGFVRHIETLRFVVPYLDQPAFAQSACKGVVELAHSKMLREPNKAEFEKPLDRVIALCKDKGLVDRAKQYKEGR